MEIGIQIVDLGTHILHLGTQIVDLGTHIIDLDTESLDLGGLLDLGGKTCPPKP